MSDDDCSANDRKKESYLQAPTSGSASRSSKKRRGSKSTKDSLIGIISELNHNLKQNTSILMQMKESLSNLTLYNEEKDQLCKEINASLHGSGEDLQRIAKLLTNSRTTLNGSRSSLTSNNSGEAFLVREEVVRVEIRIVFLKIGEIDTIKEQFQAEAFIEAKWKEPSVNIEASFFSLFN